MPKERPSVFWGYTYVLYRYVVRPLLEQGIRFALPASTFILHFGGWKSLERHAIDKPLLRARAAEVFGVPQASVCDIYGFTEQLGVVYPDDAGGLKRVPTYAEVFVRDPRTLEVVPDGQLGPAGVRLSVAPQLPGHCRPVGRLGPDRDT